MTSPAPLDSFAPYAGDMATRLMWELLGRRWVWPAVATTETVAVYPGQSAVYLAGRPVISIASITTDVDTGTQLNYQLMNGYKVELNFANAVSPGPYGY